MGRHHRRRGPDKNSEMSALTVAAVIQGQDSPVKMKWDWPHSQEARIKQADSDQ